MKFLSLILIIAIPVLANAKTQDPRISELYNRIVNLENELVTLKGKVAELSHQKGSFKKQSDAKDQDLASLDANQAPEIQYNEGRALLAQGDYAGAKETMQSFIAAYPEDPLVMNAYYWLGEIHYILGDFAKASVCFGDSYRLYKQKKAAGLDLLQYKKAPSCLLKLALAFKGLGRFNDARATLEQLEKEFIELSPVIKKRIQLARRGLDK